MSLNREDVLRELELLPVWKLRVPAEIVASAKVETVRYEKLETTEAVIATPEKPASTPATQYEASVSQDRQWAFIYEPATPMDIDSQSTLLKNILHALSIEKPSTVQMTNVAEVQASMIVALGASVAQALLNTQEPLENLRGKLHPIGDRQLLATYDLAHLLDNPLGKAKVWQELCLARSYLQSLHVQD